MQSVAASKGFQNLLQVCEPNLWVFCGAIALGHEWVRQDVADIQDV